MKKLSLALAVALFALPASALADDNASPAPRAPLTPAQRQALSTTMKTYRDKEKQMRQQLRSQILDAMSPDHRTAVAGVIGEMVISASPDPEGAAKQIDGVLSAAEQQKIVADHSAFVSQTQALMQQMHSQLMSELPAGQGHPRPPMSGGAMNHPMPNDAGTIVMMVLAHRPGIGTSMFGHGPGMYGRPGPPGGPPPGGPPPL